MLSVSGISRFFALLRMTFYVILNECERSHNDILSTFIGGKNEENFGCFYCFGGDGFMRMRRQQSSSVPSGYSGYAWLVYFHNGAVNEYRTTDYKAIVRCVR